MCAKGSFPIPCATLAAEQAEEARQAARLAAARSQSVAYADAEAHAKYGVGGCVSGNVSPDQIIQMVMTVINLPCGFREWLKDRGSTLAIKVNYGKSDVSFLMNVSNDPRCSLPGDLDWLDRVADRQMEDACGAHDVGYDLLRFYDSISSSNDYWFFGFQRGVMVGSRSQLGRPA
jgi:hypothetical protein